MTPEQLNEDLLPCTLEKMKMPTFDEMYAFLRERYLHSRFEGSPSRNAYPDYPAIVTTSHLKDLEKDGVGSISSYESRTGQYVKYDNELRVLNPDEPPAQIQKTAPNSW